MSTQAKQQGLARIAWLLLIIIIFSVVWLFIRLLPIYMNNYNVSSVLESLTTELDLRQEQNRITYRNDMVIVINKRFRINNITGVPIENLELKRTAEGMVVRLPYEERVHIVGNIDAILSFDDEVMVPKYE